MILRHDIRCSNDDTDPPRTLHLVAEPGEPPMLQHGSFDYPLDARALAAFADILTEHGYAIRPPGVAPVAPADGSCGWGWHDTRDGQPVTHVCVRNTRPRHGDTHMCACRTTIAVQQ